ncbi:DUF3089 domain-containing protein [Aurantiacibacter sp. MUD61]|uniref:DUF3089 domain-containing protein n=1 Tax=Aurantiacibacter sp. MUD61 TaxID=3009083 RepID=UPI0022F07586|nr:DUF3089 domain-containing protein [Aurantiacibacter sp. MUD61]
MMKRPGSTAKAPWRPTLRKFLYTIVFLIILVGAGAFVLRMYGEELTELTFVPDSEFVAPDALADNAYQDPAMWFSRPGKGAQNDPARWQPLFEGDEGPREEDGTPIPSADLPTPRFAVFFVHPTSYFDGRQWNAPIDDEESQARARLMVRGMASAFNQASEIWVPRYRQATFGAFITIDPQAQEALDAAYSDIEAAFAFFVDSIPADMPIVIAGHSQGGYHATRLLEEQVAGTPLQQRVAMAYPIGWPISIEHDLPSLGLPACATADQSGCIVSWASFADPPEPGQFLRRYTELPGMDGEPRGESPILCVNPLTGVMGGSADAEMNLGTLVPEDDLSTGTLVRRSVPATCADNGLLIIGNPPDLGQYVLPGNNYHVYDIPLFWQNLNEDVVRRVAAWQPAP